MAELLHRATPADLSVRGDGRTVYGLAVPFDQPADVDDGHGRYREVFRLGAFARTIRETGTKVKLLVNHDALRRLPIGRATELREDRAGLISEFHVSQTREGDEALELIRDGVLDSFSIGFQGQREHRLKDGTVERVEVRLREVSVIAFPAYAGAAIAGVRTSTPHLTPEVALRRLDLIRKAW